MEIFIYFGGGGGDRGKVRKIRRCLLSYYFQGVPLATRLSLFEGTNVKKYSQKRVDGNLFFFIKSEKQFYTFGKIL